MLCDVLGQMVVRSTGQGDGLRNIWYGLDAGCGEREDAAFHTAAIHLRDAPGTHVLKALADVTPEFG